MIRFHPHRVHVWGIDCAARYSGTQQLLSGHCSKSAGPESQPFGLDFSLAYVCPALHAFGIILELLADLKTAFSSLCKS